MYVLFNSQNYINKLEKDFNFSVKILTCKNVVTVLFKYLLIILFNNIYIHSFI